MTTNNFILSCKQPFSTAIACCTKQQNSSTDEVNLKADNYKYKYTCKYITNHSKCRYNFVHRIVLADYTKLQQMIYTLRLHCQSVNHNKKA